MIKLKITFLICVLIILVCCNRESEKELNGSQISLYESYNLIDLYPALLNANEAIRKHELDSLANEKTGVALLDEIIAEKAKSDTLAKKTIDDFPLLKVFLINTSVQNQIESSAMLGTVIDSSLVRKYLAMTDTCFEENIKWKITGELFGGHKAIFALKKNGKTLTLQLSDIDSVIVLPTGLNGLGGVAKNISDFKGISEYFVELKIRDEIKEKVDSSDYALIMDFNGKEFAGSVTSSEKYTTIGIMNNVELDYLQGKFENKIMIR